MYVHLGLGEMMMTRVLSLFSPCIWDADGFGWVRGLLHRTRVGRWVVNSFWKTVSKKIVLQVGLAGDCEELEKLIPLENAFWYATDLGFLIYPTDFYDLVRSGRVEVLRKDVAGVETGRLIKFEDGETLKTDALICSSGWRTDLGFKLLPEPELAGWGVPSIAYSMVQKEMWQKLNEAADLEILERFPKLRESMAKDEEYVQVDFVANSLRHGGGIMNKSVEYVPWRGVAPPLTGCGNDADTSNNADGGDNELMGFCFSAWGLGRYGEGSECKVWIDNEI